MTKDYQFTPQSLYNLLIHYSDGVCPLNGVVKEFLVHPNMTRKIALLVESDEWETSDPLFLGYDGKRTSSWAKGDADVTWAERNETPKLQ